MQNPQFPVEQFDLDNPGVLSFSEKEFLKQLIKIEFDPPTEHVALFLALGREKGERFLKWQETQYTQTKSTSGIGQQKKNGLLTRLFKK